MLTLWRRLRDRHYEKLVSEAISTPGGLAHESIRKRAAKWMGLKKSWCPARLRRGFIHHVLKAVRRHGTVSPHSSLGAHPIGVSNLRIECFATDSNTASVYLFGFSDNLPIYGIYRDHIDPRAVAVDVGANVGMHTLVMAYYATHGQVHSYEPSPTIFARLRHNLEINHVQNVVTRMLAVSDEVGQVGFADASKKPNIGTSHIDAAAETMVGATTLDNDLAATTKPIGLIKIDVEGHELKVLRGAQLLLKTHRPAVVIEFNGTSYSLQDLCSCFAYPVRIFKIPDTHYQIGYEIHPQQLGRIPKVFNALIVPAK